MITPAQQQLEPPESSSSSDSDHDLSLILAKLADESGVELSDNAEPQAYTTSKFDFDSLLDDWLEI